MFFFEINSLIMNLMIINALTLTFMKSPILTMLVVIIQTMLMCLMIKSMMNMSWFSFILFLIFIGGLMVLFIYIVSLASNNKFTLNYKMINSVGILVMSLITINLLTYPTNSYIFYKLSHSNYSTPNSLTLFKIYSQHSMTLTLMMMTYLLLVLLITVSIVLINESPMRSTNMKTTSL